MTNADPGFEPNEEQRVVVESALDARLLVIAGAGQGKTEVVASRIGHLVETEELSASREILVLSFSRAAVNAVRTRLTDREFSAEANVRTFDSFASLLLLDADIEPTGSFDNRIRQATKLLQEADELPDDVEELRHIIMDEVQDLVGDRADFILALLDKIDPDVGFTALGDPLQGIYNFILGDSDSKTTSDEVFKFLKKLGASQVGLGKNYRARGDDPKRVVGLGNELRESRHAELAKEVLDRFEATLPHAGELDEWRPVVAGAEKTTAVLCRSNADVLWVSRQLRREGIDHVIRREAQEFGAPSWIATSLGRMSGPAASRVEVDSALRLHMNDEEAEDRWHLLKGAEGNAKRLNELNLGRLRSMVREGSLPLTLTQRDTSKVVVSTIHRAKGLEFDRVVFAYPGYDRKDPDFDEMVKTSYVALSRARDGIVIVDLKPGRYIKQEYWLKGRWQERVRTAKKSTRTKSLEVKVRDTDVDRPFDSPFISAESVQTNLRDRDLAGIDIEAHLDLTLSTVEIPIYDLRADDGRVLGRTSESFGDAFVRAFGQRQGTYPATLAGLSLVSVDTVAGDPQFTEQAGIGLSGFWLVPRVVGLAEPDWKYMEDVS
ncbi:UNVERIFIED_CONTAM: DNA helicase-2/ATP-dependent DNA helicase PcrA [Williamsia faeni]